MIVGEASKWLAMFLFMVISVTLPVTEAKKVQEQEAKKRTQEELPISFKKYKSRKMKPHKWLRLDFEYKQGLLPNRCVPLPLDWKRIIPEWQWWLPQAEKDGWWLEAGDSPQLQAALRRDYTDNLLKTLEDYSTGGNVGRHEGGNMVLVIEGLQRTGKSDLAKTIAKHWQMLQWRFKGRKMVRKGKDGKPIRDKDGKVIRGVKPKIHVVLSNKDLNETLKTMSDMDILILDEMDKWTGLGSKNRAEGYANLVSRIAKTGKSFIFVSPEVRIPTIKGLAYIVLTTFGICYWFEATRFIVSRKSRVTQQYRMMGIAALQRNWRFAEFRDYHMKKNQSIRESERTLGLTSGFDQIQVEEDRIIIWDEVYRKMYDQDEELFFAFAISTEDWRAFANELRDKDGNQIVDIEGLGSEYAKYVCKRLSSRHRTERRKWQLEEKKGKRLSKYSQDIPIDALPKEVSTIPDAEMPDDVDLEGIRVSFVPIANMQIPEDYFDVMYNHADAAMSEKWSSMRESGFLQKVRIMRDALISWRLQAYLQSTRQASTELTREGKPRSHTTVSKHYGKVNATIVGIMDELAFIHYYPFLTRTGGDTGGLRDMTYDKDGESILTVSKKCRSDKYWKPDFKELSRDEKLDVLEGKPVYMVLTEMETHRLIFWVVKVITTTKHEATLKEWSRLASDMFDFEGVGASEQTEGQETKEETTEEQEKKTSKKKVTPKAKKS
jgi:hypothetical protein